jgi:hypothetical protein
MVAIRGAIITFALLVPIVRGGVAYRAYGGFIPAGGDIGTLPAGSSVAAASAACDAAASCAGFTFEGPRGGPSPGTVYLKNATAAGTFVPDANSTWTTYLPVVGPCDILLAAGHPCVAAYSMVRALYGAYGGKLYTLTRSDGAALSIGTAAGTGGVADAAAHDAFCARAATCVVSALIDQSPAGNDLGVAPQERGGFDLPVNASRFPITVNGAKAYGAFFEPQMGYRNTTGTGMATGNEEESMFFVVDGTRENSYCCFDFGNAGKLPGDFGDGSMEAVYWGSSSGWSHGFQSGPWVGADLENGIYYGNPNGSTYNPGNMPLRYPFVFAQLKGGANGFTLKAADATQGKLQTMWAGPRPSEKYQPMQKRGGIILGIGGDNTREAVGTFFEGVIAQGFTEDAVDDALQRSVVEAGYGQ